MINIHIVSIVRLVDINTNGGVTLAKFLNSPRMGVVNAITVANERCWIVYEVTGPISIPHGSSLEELVCEVALAMTHTIFLTLTACNQSA